MRNLAALLLLLATGVGMADVGLDDEWMAQMRASDPSGGHAMQIATFGTGDVPHGLLNANPGDCAEVYCYDLGGDPPPPRWNTDVRDPMGAGETQTWHLIVTAGASYGYSQIKLAGWNQSGSTFDLNGLIPVKLVVINDPGGSYPAGTVLWRFDLDPNINGTSASPTYTSLFNWTGQQIRLDLVAGGSSGGPPTVTDDGTYTSGTSSLHASWSCAGAVEFQYAIGESQQSLVVGWKTAGTSPQATEGNMSLQSGKTYHWYVKARFGDGSWSGVGASDGILAAAARIIGEARAGQAGAPVYLADSVVTSTATDPSGLWVESAGGESAIKIGASWSTTRGDRIDAAGITAWSDGVPTLSSPELKRRVSGTPRRPTFVRNSDLAGDRTESLSYQGINLVGLLAAVFGGVTAVDGPARVFYLDDGSHLQDGMGPSGNQYVGLRVAYPSGTTPPAVGSRVRVTGVRTIIKVTLDHNAYVNGTLRGPGETIYLPLLTMRDAADVMTVNQ